MRSPEPATRIVLAALAGLVCAALRVPEAALAVPLLGRPRIALLLAAALAAGWGAMRVSSLDRRVLRAGPVQAVVEVTGQPRGDRALARVEGSGEDVVLDAPMPIEAGARYRVTGTLRPVEGPAAAYYATQGAHLELTAGGASAVGRRDGVWGLVDGLHRGARRALGADPAATQERALVAGITLGDDDALDDEHREQFRSSGLSHIVAVSGQNVALVIAFTLVAAGVVGVLGGPARWTAAGVAVLYVLLTGAGPSVLRAGVAGTLALAAWIVSRPVHRWHLVAWGAVVVLAANPLDLFNPGFQLSFAAVAAILVVTPRVRPGLLQALAVSVACTLATAPIAWWHFGRVSLLAVPANLLALPAVGPILLLGLASEVAWAMWPPLAQPLLGVADVLAAYVLWVAGACS